MAKPTNQHRSLAPPDHDDSPPLKPIFRATSSASIANNHSMLSKLDSSIAAVPNPSSLSTHIPFSTLHSQTGFSSQRSKNLNPPPALSVSSMLKSKPHLQKIPSGGDEKLSKVCRELGRKKFFDEKKETDDGFDKKGLCLVVKEKEEKELKEPQKEQKIVSLRPTVSLLRKSGRRKSFAVSQVELSDIFAKNGVKVVSVDMQPGMQIHAVDCARKTHDSMEKFTSKTLALSLKREFDGAYGPAWHCIVGTSFGSFVTHSVGGSYISHWTKNCIFYCSKRPYKELIEIEVDVQNTAGKSNKFGILEFKRGKRGHPSEYLYIDYVKKHTNNTEYSLQYV